MVRKELFPAAERTIPSDLTAVGGVQDEIEQVLLEHRYSQPDRFRIRLALEEALVNAIKHGNQMDRTKRVHVAYRVRPDRFDIQITDEGSGFEPEELPDPTAAENLERPSGRGVLLMRRCMTEIRFNDRGNSVVMCKVPARTSGLSMQMPVTGERILTGAPR